MGWFWADAPATPSTTERLTRPPPNHPTSGNPPPSCPMHASNPPPAPKDISECPYVPPSPESPHDSSSLNPLNLMFASLSQSPSAGQKTVLPTEREISSIPKGTASEGNWEYPSPQQMYNAMRRKGYEDAPEDAVESMVAVHNFLNEGAWGEIVGWEKRFSGGILNALVEQAQEAPEPRLLRFQGRSKDLTPKAQMLQFLGRVYPSKFGNPPPFDRHDWYVLRTVPGSAEQKEIRYVIDYYSGPPEPTGEPVFYLDVRPALDRPSAILERVVMWGGDVWERASGADVRRAAAAERAARRE